jgi:aerobic-type carbon monoxide dehydrogenase small subunit (CoxS/CutS family)
MEDQDNIIVTGDRVRIRHGRNAGETVTVDNVTWHVNQFGAYAQAHIMLDDGQADVRTMEGLEKAKETSGIVPLTTALNGMRERQQ